MREGNREGERYEGEGEKKGKMELVSERCAWQVKEGKGKVQDRQDRQTDRQKEQRVNERGR